MEAVDEPAIRLQLSEQHIVQGLPYQWLTIALTRRDRIIAPAEFEQLGTASRH